MIIDGLPVLVEFISEEADQEVIKKSEEWKSKHVRESQYFLQIVKCKDSKCCSPFRSSYLKVVKDRFLPAPISVKEVSLREQIEKKQKATQSDIPTEPPSKQSAETVQLQRLRPQRVAARPQKELLCAFQFQKLEWMELDDVEPAILLKQRLWYRCFPVNFVKFLRTPFLQNTYGRLLLKGIMRVYMFLKNLRQMFLSFTF